MLPRQLEPEVMDTREEAHEYNAMDNVAVNRLFADEVLSLIETAQPDSTARLTLIDPGTGTVLIPIEICSRNQQVQIIAADLATEMLKVAAENLRSAELTDRISLELADARQLPCADQSMDGVISNSLIHHLPEPLPILQEMLRVIKPGGFLFLRDLARPDSMADLESLVERYAAKETPHQRQLLHDSLHAALTLDEVRDLLTACGLPPASAQLTSDRHWTISLRLAHK
ncbi:class I SAM-dependent methyltransferase [Gimesia panareensis]|uniref:Demethylrebeccamycin-D-glucose O-methyltransferase n=1 Tax=Gimesia panareensis TaxID=2527978 RepID=A0A517QFV1_9PLAN|nr:class I SAM-dependent methyltransferase [Gimesia panareensis]QDT30526.1 Demethylrebeccamycin-D-glucose O-methyltransferase [Gimesia panareensis]QDU53583.1 Demethylrebeccamycin-D-glucose O-methyltransferase [Gimesia panareensis]